MKCLTISERAFLDRDRLSRRENSMFSKTSRTGMRLKDWKMKPIFSRR